MTHGFSLPQISLRTETGEVPDAADIARPFGDADCTPGVQKIEGMGTLETVIVSGQYQPFFRHPDSLRLVHVEKVPQQSGIGALEIIDRPFHLATVVDVPVLDPLGPLQIVDIVDPLDIHGDPFDAVGQFHADGMKIEPADLLEVGELRDFHPVEPHLPAESPGADRGRFPVVFHETNIVFQGVDPEALEGVEIELLDVQRRRLQEDLILIVVLQAVGVFAVATVRGPPGRFHIGNLPGFRSQGPQKGGRVEGSGAHLDVVGLLDHASLRGPVPFEGEDQFLKGHNSSCR